MSVLNFPRIYLNGHMFWNPPTANNNDVFPLYDAVNADINWPFMSHFDINATNAPTQLMPWAIKPLAMSDLPTYVELRDVALIAATAFVLCCLSNLYPAWRAAMTEPARALRHE